MSSAITVELSRFPASSAKEALRGAKEVDLGEERFFWVGSVDAENLQKSDRFLRLAESGSIEELTCFSDMARNVIYAFVAEQTGNEVQLFVIQMLPEPLKPQRCLMSKRIRGIAIREKPAVKVPIKVGFSLWDVVKNLFR